MITSLSAILLLALSTPPPSDLIYAFSTQTTIREWRIVNDGVMGGISRSSMMLTDAGHGRFSGQVSTANNGGFASVQLTKAIDRPKEKSFVVLRVKGDGKRYEFRLKNRVRNYESYVHNFPTTGDWETIRLPIADFYPEFRGRRLRGSNFNFDRIEQVSIFIANGRAENFELLIDWIGLE
jgi:hypothetical protein